MDRYGLICRSFYENPDVTQRELASILNPFPGDCE